MKLGIVDTTFSRVDMGSIALDEMKGYSSVEVVRRTVPGVKDLGVECKKLLDEGCDACMALGMVGGAPIDTQCAHEASLGIQQAKLMTNKHIIEVFVHENEAWSGKEFVEICDNRIRKHVHNAVLIVENPGKIMENAGKGVRQGKDDEGPISGEKAMIGIVVSEFNKDLTGRMLKKALDTCDENNVEAKVSAVPGAYDMPLVVKKMLMDKKIKGIATLGAVVKGETAHDEVITKDAARRLGRLSLEFNKPVSLGIVGHDAERHLAEARAEAYAERAVKAVLHVMRTLEE